MLSLRVLSTAVVYALVASNNTIGTQALPISLVSRANGWNNPADGGGSSLAYFPDNPNGEPLNVIVSGASSADVLSLNGFKAWYSAIGFGRECFGLHSGTKMQANLGDAQGLRDQEDEVRESFGEDPFSGSCLESLVGGNHFRYWQQANTKAWFLAVSDEKNIAEHHDITSDGYNGGRDDVVSRATKGGSWNGRKFTATVSYVTGLLPTGTAGINHGNEGVGVDGRTAVLTITSSQA